MTITVVLVHLLLALVLFVAMNWIGGHAVVTAKYYQITYFSRYDDAPAFNVAFRILTPVVFIAIAGAILYGVGLQRYVTGLYMVVVYQQIIRWAYLVLYGRRLLLRWMVQFTVAAITWAVAFFAYQQIISDPARLLPDFDNLANELWLIILAFLYKLADQSRTPAEGNGAAKQRYLSTRYEALRGKFGSVIDEYATVRRLEPLVYAVLVYETFNRPKLVRLLERIIPVIGVGPRSYGPMQVQAGRPLSDVESVREGTRRLASAYLAAYQQLSQAHPQMPDHHRAAAMTAAQHYNVRGDYPQEVMSIHDFLVEKYYTDLLIETVGAG